MITAKKMLHFFLYAQILITYNSIFPAEYEPQSVVDIAHLPAKLKTIITFVYGVCKPKDRTQELNNVYKAIQENKNIISHSIVHMAARNALTFLESHEDYFANKEDFMTITMYLKN